MPLFSFANKRFWDRIAPKYARDTIADMASYERKLRETAALMHPDMQVLEIGCGTGSTAIHHAPRVAHITASDLSGKMLEIARSRAKAAGVQNITFVQSAIDDLPPPAELYDMIMAHSILHLVEDPAAVIQQMSKWLRPGGYLVTSTICMADGMGLFRLITHPAAALRLLPGVRYLRQQDLTEAMQQAGLNIHTQWQPGPRKALFLIGEKPI